MNPAIQVENLSKLYHIGRTQQRHDTLRDALVAGLQAPWQRLRRTRHAGQPDEDALWALKDVSFEVQPGEVVGIIGRNGAGKSTLLKILSRITEPTSGRAVINGRVGSLLEVGTGFHPELTGRENIYLNGAILGMRRKEIERRFDEIVAFAEIEKFLDTPVKRYSSGMYVRLAFAVAAHLEPEILLVDEVLAVGDAAFQKKCLGKMNDVARHGRTILFVSHNMGAIAELCPKSLLLRSGKVSLAGSSGMVIRNYLIQDGRDCSDVHIAPETKPDVAVLLTRCFITNLDGVLLQSVDVTSGFRIGLEILSRRAVKSVDISIRFCNALGNAVCTSNLSDDGHGNLMNFFEGKYSFHVDIPAKFFAPDTYYLTIGIHQPNAEVLDLQENIISFPVEESGSSMWQYQYKGYGNVLVQFPWQ